MRWINILSVWWCGVCGAQNRDSSGGCVNCNHSRYAQGMKKLTAVERDDAFEEIDTLIERDLNSAFAAALNHGSSGRQWSELAAAFRRGAELADALAFADSAPNPEVRRG